ncbi:hypothetical protein [Methylacidimicrobium tartarophylax]|uniref:hypothetical protein n=1 Tax=Methylacidimicrobium tartarophylax TaxID=1041768 RepID=UPI0015B76694|nr:hypothetical protein [Methylacidimicrobium tartarophylax]
MLCMLAALRVAFGAAYFPPSPRPEEISEEVWQELFEGKPVVIVAHVATGKGVSWYNIHDWDKSLKGGGIGPDEYYVRVEHGEVTVPWFMNLERAELIAHSYGIHKRKPSWTSLGLTLPEATEMEKQDIEQGIQLSSLEEVRQRVREAYSKLARGVGDDVDYECMFPEVIEAYKQLGVLPRNFVPPKIPDKPQFTKEEREAVRKALALRKQQWEEEQKAKEEHKRMRNAATPAQGP